MNMKLMKAIIAAVIGISILLLVWNAFAADVQAAAVKNLLRATRAIGA